MSPGTARRVQGAFPDIGVVALRQNLGAYASAHGLRSPRALDPPFNGIFVAVTIEPHNAK